jgi:hypothetical protein
MANMLKSHERYQKYEYFTSFRKADWSAADYTDSNKAVFDYQKSCLNAIFKY